MMFAIYFIFSNFTPDLTLRFCCPFCSKQVNIMHTAKVILFGIILICCAHVMEAQERHKGDNKKPFIWSQQFKHSLGAGAAFYEFNKSNEPVFHIDYNPSLSLTRSHSDFSVSAGTQLAGGYHFGSSVDETDFIYADLPLLIELNFGNNASKDFYNDLGWFIGGGYSYHLFKEKWNHGPEATLGVRAFFFGPSLTLRYSHYFNIKEGELPLNTITLLLNMGRYFEQVKLNNKVSRFK